MQLHLRKACPAILMLWTLSACEPPPALTRAPRAPLVARLDSLAAARIAHAAARRWDDAPVLWYQAANEAGMEYQWVRSGAAYEWTLLFAARGRNDQFAGRVARGRVVEARPEASVERVSPVQDGFPADRPGLGLAAAAAAVVDAGAPVWERPMAYYLIDNPKHDYLGRPVWELAFASQSAIYVVDALAGTMIEAKDLETDALLSPAELRARLTTVPRPDVDCRNVIWNFFDALDAADYSRAAKLLDPRLLARYGEWFPASGSLARLERVEVRAINGSAEPDAAHYQVELAALPEPLDASLWPQGDNRVQMRLCRNGREWLICHLEPQGK